MCSSLKENLGVANDKLFCGKQVNKSLSISYMHWLQFLCTQKHVVGMLLAPYSIPVKIVSAKAKQPVTVSRQNSSHAASYQVNLSSPLPNAL
jgi:hypothetical protein